MDSATLVLIGGSVDLSLWVGAFRALQKAGIAYPRIIAAGTAWPFAALLASGYSADEIGKRWAALIRTPPQGGVNPATIEDWLRQSLEANEVFTFADLQRRESPEVKFVAIDVENQAALTLDNAEAVALADADVAATALASSGISGGAASLEIAGRLSGWQRSGRHPDIWTAVEDLVKPETKALYLYSEPAGLGSIRSYVAGLLSPKYKDIFELDEKPGALGFQTPSHRLRQAKAPMVQLKLPRQWRINPEVVSKSAELEAATALSNLGLDRYAEMQGLEPTSEVREATTIQRYPDMNINGKIDRGQKLTVSIDLKLASDAETDVAPLLFEGLDPSWQEFDVTVRLMAPFLIFKFGEQRGSEQAGFVEGVIKVQNAKPSIPFTVICAIKKDLPQALRHFDLKGDFFYRSRYLGSVARMLHVEGDSGARPEQGMETQAKSKTSERAVPAPKWVYLAVDAPEPTLTIRIHHPEGTEVGFLEWHMTVPQKVYETCPGLPAKMRDHTKVGSDAKSFAEGLMKAFEGQKAGEHMELFAGLGQQLYEKAPQAFKDVYWSLAACFGQDFPIQFITDEPYVPWEFMLLVKGDNTEAKCMAVSHPVARWLDDYEGRRRSNLPSGRIVTIAPIYPSDGDVPPLPAARAESAKIKEMFNAIPVQGVRPDVLYVFQDGLNVQVSILHFAGHGKNLSDLRNAIILLEHSQQLAVLEVRTPKTILGTKRKSLALFNVCGAATPGESLGTVCGWAEALINKNFSGFVAPMWAVYDQSAAAVTTQFLNSITNDKQPVAEALRQIREQHGSISPTYLSYIFYGDVMAKLSGKTN
jgi:hypothetical protein